jgi:hypothetical protein
MERSRLLVVYGALLLVIFGLIVLHAPLTVWLGTIWPHAAPLIKSWKELLMLPAMLLGVVLVSRQGLWHEFGRDWLFRLIVAYAVLHITLVVLLPREAWSMLAGLAIDLRYVLFFGLVYALIRMAPHWRKYIIYTGMIGAMVVVGFAALQTVLPRDLLSHIGYSKQTIAPYLTVDENPDYVRYNSTLRGPNPLGAYAGIILALLVSLLVRGKLALQQKRVLWLTLAVGICSAVALWISYSRSALVAALVAVALVVAMTQLHHISRRMWLGLAVAGCFLLGGLVVARDTSFVSNVILHENATTGADVNSNEGHVESLVFGIDRLLHQPLGAGVGSTGSASLYATDGGVIIENQYLFIAHETGWLGLLLFIAIFGLVMVRLWHARADWLALGTFASGIGLTFIGLLLPVWVDDTVAIIWWALAAVAIGYRHER